MPSHYSRTTLHGTTVASVSGAVDAGNDPDRVLIVIFRTGHENITHNAPTYDGVPLTNIIPQFDAANNRDTSVWKMVDPPAGSTTLEATASGTASGFAVTAIVVHGADNVDVVENIGLQAASTDVGIDITAASSDSLVYASVISISFNSDPYTPDGGVTEVEDSNGMTAISNITWATGYVNATGASQHLGWTSNAANEWGAVAFEVTSTTAGITKQQEETEQMSEDTLTYRGIVKVETE